MPLMPDSKVAKDRYHVCLKTLSRWDEKPELKFPAPKVINNRKYRDINELDAWDVARALTETAKPTPRGVAAELTAKSSAPVPLGKTSDTASHAETEAT
jgi:hypothetical protein